MKRTIYSQKMILVWLRTITWRADSMWSCKISCMLSYSFHPESAPSTSYVKTYKQILKRKLWSKIPRWRIWKWNGSRLRYFLKNFKRNRKQLRKRALSSTRERNKTIVARYRSWSATRLLIKKCIAWLANQFFSRLNITFGSVKN